MNIYKRNPRLDAIFNGAKDRKHVLVVALDFAKSDHTVLFTHGEGEQIRDPFTVKNNLEGCKYLIEAIKRTSGKYRVKPHHVVIAGEGLPSFARSFLSQIQQLTKHALFHVHARDAKDRRPSTSSSSDKSDLVGIAKSILEGLARSLHPLHSTPDYSSIARIPGSPGDHIPVTLRTYEDLFSDSFPLRELTRERFRIVQHQTRCTNKIHALTDRLFPGFLTPKQAPLTPFSKASLKLLESDFFSAEQIGRKRPATLLRFLQSLQVKDLPSSVTILLELAHKALPSEPVMRDVLQTKLHAQVSLYRAYAQAIANLDVEIEKRMIHSPASLLLSFRGIGITLAAGIYAEVGAGFILHPVTQLCAYAGVIPSTKQTGGPDKEPVQGKTRKGCNRILKNYLVQAAMHIGRHGPSDLQETYRKLTENGQHADFAIARRLLRSFRLIMIHQSIYLPKDKRGRPSEQTGELADYYVEQWGKISEKWKNKHHFAEACQPENPLGLWAQAQHCTFNNTLGYPLELPYCPPPCPEQTA